MNWKTVETKWGNFKAAVRISEDDRIINVVMDAKWEDKNPTSIKTIYKSELKTEEEKIEAIKDAVLSLEFNAVGYFLTCMKEKGPLSMMLKELGY